MPIISPHSTNPLIDGRQSDRAMMVRRGVQRLFADLKLSMVPELALASGRRADLVALGPSGEIWIVEIKSSIEDFRTDSKWPDYRQHCDRLFFATHAGVPADIFPEDCGLIIADEWSGHLLREAPEHRLAAATRKAMMLRFARSAADRLLLAELAAGAS
ncbi:MmcB family DNA repair protein [uncultured Hoeflea sp.]|uniref:MmcB family DNA repair protein n=1 Tax=uncultured Hoeflea sp. TaxID=538666 RepID=UPI0030EB6FEB|tara:strand:+ start:137097 stop:137573 length:477 start_codon:yes stop_codon:yes gene_type:complete